MTKKRKFDWQKFWVHAFFGAVLGAIIGLTFSFFLNLVFDIDTGLCMATGAIVYGLVAGLKGDDFWSMLSH